jgi:coenzyme PQQ precursor peptide PqqA
VARERPITAAAHLVFPLGEDAEMKWTKPEFEIADLCLEVTSYVYRR